MAWFHMFYRKYPRQPLGLAALFLLLLLSGWLSVVSADSISLGLGVKSVDDKVLVTLSNSSKTAVAVTGVAVELAAHEYLAPSLNLPAGQEITVSFQVNMPTVPGSYPLITTVNYMNERQPLSLLHVASFYYQRPAFMAAKCTAVDGKINETGILTAWVGQPGDWRIILPSEIEVLNTVAKTKMQQFEVATLVQGFTNVYPYFVVRQEVRKGVNYLAMCQGKVSLVADAKSLGTIRGYTPDIVLQYTLLSSLLLAVWALLIPYQSRRITAAGKYASRALLLSGFYYGLRHIDGWLEALLPYANADGARYFNSLLIEHFRSSHYQNFFYYFVDGYFWFCVLVALPFLYRFDADKSLRDDKYSAFIYSLITWVRAPFSREPVYWTFRSRLGMLTIAVKVFFMPMLVSWVISNLVHLHYVLNHWQWGFYNVNAFLVSLLILVDTGIFAFGYIVESKYLKNEIRSVEPTVVGWLVCLWCYPPFNHFSFNAFNYEFFDPSRSFPEWVNILILCVITGLWTIFVWASVALGPRGSNLTNRGIVDHGPYRFVRHPAYMSKVSVWFLQCIFMSEFSPGTFAAYATMYALRAWTEERHLSADPDYVAYKQKVRWKLIPKVF